MNKKKFPKQTEWNPNAKCYKGTSVYIPIATPAALNELNPSRSVVWRYLASRCITKPWCWPSVRLIAKQTNLAPNTITTCIRELQAAKLIVFGPAPWMGKREKRRPVNIYFVLGMMDMNYAMARKLLTKTDSDWYLTGQFKNCDIRLYKEKGEGNITDNPLPPLQGAKAGGGASFISDPETGTIRPRFSFLDQHNGKISPFAMGVDGVYCKDLTTDRHVSASEQGLMPADPEEDTELDDLMATAEQGLMSPITDSESETDDDTQPSRLVSSNPEPRKKKSDSRRYKTGLRAFVEHIKRVYPHAYNSTKENPKFVASSARACGAPAEAVARHFKTNDGPMAWAPTDAQFLDSLETTYHSGVSLEMTMDLGVPADTDLGDIWALMSVERRLTPAEIAQVVHGKLGPLSEKQFGHLLARPEIRQRLAEDQGYSSAHSRDLVMEVWEMGPLESFENDLVDLEVYPDVVHTAEWLWVLQRLYPLIPLPLGKKTYTKMYQYGEQTDEFISLEEQALEAMPKGVVPSDEFFETLIFRSKHRKTELRMLEREDFQAYMARKLGFPSFEALILAHGAGGISPTQFDAIDWWDALRNVLCSGDNTPQPILVIAADDPTDNPQPLPKYESAYSNN